MGSPAPEVGVPAWIVVPLEFMPHSVESASEEDAKIVSTVGQEELASVDALKLSCLVASLSVRQFSSREGYCQV